MLNLFEQLVFWHWLLLAAVLLIVELTTGSGFLFWMGISSAIIGFLVWIFPDISWATQVLGFAVLAILTAVIWWLYLKRHPIKTDKPSLNRRGQQYVGRIFTLDAPVVNGMGSIRVDDSMWRVRCSDLPAGSRIRITGVDGVILIGEVVKDS
jgi:membrane protein implicated in regulation of membrane protease activity